LRCEREPLLDGLRGAMSGRPYDGHSRARAVSWIHQACHKPLLQRRARGQAFHERPTANADACGQDAQAAGL